MKRSITTLSLGIVLSFGISAQDLPKPSPMAKVEQRVGLTDLTITYSRPGVKNRTIWGDLVPYGKLWRAGANKATLFTTTSDIIIGDQTLPEGEYSLFILPKKEGAWEVVFNNETELWGTGKYNQEDDQLRIMATPQKMKDTPERMEFHFIDVDMNNATLVMDWAGIRLSLKVEADPTKQVMINIENALADAEEDDRWMVLRNAASFARDTKMTKEGLTWITESVKLKNDNWYSYWVYAQLLAQNGENKDAVSKAEKSIEIGLADAKESGSPFNYEERIKADIASWK